MCTVLWSLLTLHLLEVALYSPFTYLLLFISPCINYWGVSENNIVNVGLKAYCNYMEVNKNVMPEFNIFPRVRKVVEFLGSLLVPFHCQAEPYMSEHYRGADEVLSEPLEVVSDWPYTEA